MRVIAGEFRSRVLKSLPGHDTRPTPDRLRETLFNILASRVEDTVFVDAYAGTGAVGIEALSRGARRAIFIERSRSAIGVIRDNLATLGLVARSEVFSAKTSSVLERLEWDIAFIDPPYERETEYGVAMDQLGLRPRGLAIAQHPSRLELKPKYGNLRRYRVVKQGDNSLSFYDGCEPERPEI